MHRRRFLTLFSGMITLAGLFPLHLQAQGLFPAPRRKTYRVVSTYPHDPTAFTQGLLFHEGRLYESTGGWGTSSVREVELKTGRVIRQHNLAPEYFGEGLAIWGDRLIQVTWKSGTGFVYDLSTFDQLEIFSYPGEGWGLTQDHQGLILSDGTNVIRRLDPSSFQETGRTAVHLQGRPMRGLNELEYIDGAIWANVFPTDEVVLIDPASGDVLAHMGLTGILGPRRRTSPDAVANGIAYDPETRRIFVTGKLWPVLFEIQAVPG